jgi:hypothetical protein
MGKTVIFPLAGDLMSSVITRIFLSALNIALIAVIRTEAAFSTNALTAKNAMNAFFHIFWKTALNAGFRKN